MCASSLRLLLVLPPPPPQPSSYPSASFSTSILALFQRLNLPHWSQPSLTDQNIKIDKVSGAMTNAVFFVSFVPSASTPASDAPTMVRPLLALSLIAAPPVARVDPFTKCSWSLIPLARLAPLSVPPTQLLRVYGPSSMQFISRPSELRILHLLSSRYSLGPKLHGTFANGRLEEYFPSRALTAADLRDPETSRSIGKRMAELHSVDLDVLDPLDAGGDGSGREPTVLQSIKEWISPARTLYARLEKLDAAGELKGLLAGWVQSFDLARLEKEIAAYIDWLKRYERGRVEGEEGKAWRMVFCRALRPCVALVCTRGPRLTAAAPPPLPFLPPHRQRRPVRQPAAAEEPAAAASAQAPFDHRRRL